MLYQFLIDNRTKILASTRKKTDAVSRDKPTTSASERGLPQFYDHLTGQLEREAKGLPPVSEKSEGPDTTAKHGVELKRLGYTVSQVVQGYGVICQAITEQAQAAHARISAEEFKTLNLTLDKAIAEAVTGFAARVGGVECDKKLDSLAQELRGDVSAALFAHSLVKKGVVGAGGSTNALMERSLERMRDVIDRSLAESHAKAGKRALHCGVFLLDVAEEVEAATSGEAQTLGAAIEVDVDAGRRVAGDWHDLTAALSKKVHEALKAAKKGGVVRVTSRDAGGDWALAVSGAAGTVSAPKFAEIALRERGRKP